ncbi:MAG: hypothetical protein BGO69_19900 [Bacteroidetes bacterium 46-16]|nr:MAG: hypothetical protein BGO69_19900 [Bacteroidetes bacterium 46-16]
MKYSGNRKTIAILTICFAIATAQTFAQKEHHHDERPPQNLKVLPKNTTGEEIHTIMRGYSLSLGVRCNFCHAATEGEKPKFDFPSDEKPEKEIARKMIKMVDAINNKYLAKIEDGSLERITCVTCHMGRPKPLVSVDSLPKKNRD